MSGAFDVAFDLLMEYEGGYVNDPQDPGGETRWGISKTQYPQIDIANLTREQAKKIYKSDYWDQLSLDSIKYHAVAIELFEQAVNFGVGAASRHAQHAINLLGGSIVEDGFIGPQTITAINAYSSPAVLQKVLNGLQFARYVKITEGDPVMKRFFKGWLKRVTIAATFLILSPQFIEQSIPFHLAALFF